MGIREKMNKSPALWIAIAVIVVLAISAEAYHYLAPAGAPKINAANSAAPAFYTTDDGKTLFSDSGALVAPFDHNGQQAVKAFVYTCGGKQVVQCLEKYSAGPGSALMVKKPGPRGDWIADSDPAAQAIRQPKCPDGGTPAPVVPVIN